MFQRVGTARDHSEEPGNVSPPEEKQTTQAEGISKKKSHGTVEKTRKLPQHMFCLRGELYSGRVSTFAQNIQNTTKKILLLF